LIGPRHVLTAGHCLFDSIDGSAGTSAVLPVSSITVSPGRNGGSTHPFGTTVMQSFQVNATWRASRNARFDYGLIVLRDAIGDRNQAALGGQKLGYWGSPTLGAGTVIEPQTPASLGGKAVNISGYPADKATGTQWRAAGSVVNTSPSAGSELIYYDVDTCGGHSGSPIWIKTGETRNAVAIHTGPCISGSDCSRVAGAACYPTTSRYSSNRGVRISASLLQDVRNWMGAGGSRPILRSGSKGAAVVDLQSRLNAWRLATPGVSLAPLVMDGDFGPKTHAMVVAFQRKKGLTVDGVVGPQTWGALLAP
jgi:V8-like Glu-specific endopeptidase